MFDIGIPEFGVIAIVALVVLGPERLPEVMRQAGKWYRQAMVLRSDLMSQVADAQRTFREEMDAVERAAAVDLTEVAVPDSALPPPPFRQVPAWRRQPDKAHEAGPFLLAAWYRDLTPDIEIPALATSSRSPFGLVPVLGDPLLGNAYVTSTRALTARVHPFDDPTDALTEARRVALRAPAPFDRLVATPTMVVPQVPAPEIQGESDAERLAREGTIITLFEAGFHTKETASGALDLSLAEFERRLATRRPAAPVAVAVA